MAMNSREKNCWDRDFWKYLREDILSGIVHETFGKSELDVLRGQ